MLLVQIEAMLISSKLSPVSTKSVDPNSLNRARSVKKCCSEKIAFKVIAYLPASSAPGLPKAVASKVNQILA